MAILHVRGVPEELYERIRQLAQAQHRSLSVEVISLLAQAVEEEDLRQEQAALLDSITRNRIKLPPGVDVVALIREDRER